MIPRDFLLVLNQNRNKKKKRNNKSLQFNYKLKSG